MKGMISMLCEKCQKKVACVHITKVNNNQKIEKHLCEDCAKEMGEVNFSSLSLDNKLSVQDFLKGMFSFASEPEVPQNSTCNNCGLSYSEFSRNGKLGCSYCYGTFSDRLEPLLRRIHGASNHTGKIPVRTGEVFTSRQKLKKLKQQLTDCISNEEYEMAAKLRDEIRAIEGQLIGGTEPKEGENR
jgi:protein arginine kinase activator